MHLVLKTIQRPVLTVTGLGGYNRLPSTETVERQVPVGTHRNAEMSVPCGPHAQITTNTDTGEVCVGAREGHAAE